MLGEVSPIPTAPALRPPRAPLAPAEGRGRPAPDGDGSAAMRLGGLVLTRHPGESIMIGEDVEVQVVGLRSGTVRIRVVAPRSVAVHRREVFDAIRADPSTPEVDPATPEVASPRAGEPRGGLVLTRSARQSIMIGDRVELAVVEVRPAAVKLRVSAPRSVAVHRREVFDAIRDGRA